MDGGVRRLGGMAAPHWLALYAALLASWLAVWAMAAPDGSDLGRLLSDICRATPDAAGLGGAYAMWLVMAAAMMLPTALPAFATYDEVAQAHGLGGGARLVAGYAAVWVGASAVAALGQVALAAAGLVAADGAAAPLLAAGLLVLAAGYQVTPLKAACLSRCRAPLTFFMAHWDRGPWAMGLRLGLVCLGCCWALMALAFAGGTLSLGFMALGTALMTAEKLAAGPRASRTIAIACLVGAGYVIGGTT